MLSRTMSVQEFLHKDDEIEQISFKINKNENLRKVIVFSIASLMYCKEVYAADPNGKIDKAGMVILGLCRKFGYWACIAMCALEIIKSLMSGDTKSISKIISKYAVGFGALYFLPWLFDLIASIFS